MDSSAEKTPTRKKHRKKETQETPTQENFIPSILKITTISQTDLPSQRDYFFANKQTLTKHGFLIGQPVKLTPVNTPHAKPYICQPWPVENMNRNCIALFDTRLKMMGVVEGDSVQVEIIEFRIRKAIFVKMKLLGEVEEIVDEAACGYLATQLNGKYVCDGSKFSVFYSGHDVILETTEVRGSKQENLTEQISQLSLFDSSSIPEGDSLDTSDSVTTSTPSRCEKVNIEVYIFSSKTVLIIEHESKQKCVAKEKAEISEIKLEDLAGLESQVREIQDIIDLALATDAGRRNFRMIMPSGVLVCGIGGVGKTTLLKGLADYYNKGVKVIYMQMENYTSSEGFSKDLATSEDIPRLILLDDIDSITAHKDYLTGTNSLVGSICGLMDRLRTYGGVMVATCQMRDGVDASLRRHGRFEKEVDLSAPRSEHRSRILQTLLELTPNSVSVSVSELSEIAWRAHGYVAGDLSMLLREAVLSLVGRQRGGGLEEAKLEYRDLQDGLKKVRPSALRDVILEVPRVKWSDIGGIEEIIQRIKETVEWPLKHPEAFARLGVTPPKGILLYGPPGCSKTMIARAIATESGLNFLAVKGPEVFSKWVGDSEKAIRDIFTKARMASPSIIFFDEIDALAVEREGQGSRVSDRVLTQLLTEMDGLERLEGVTVVAATNRPDLIDKALLRPGRMDRLIYIPIPDPVTRKEIYRIKLEKMSCEANLDLSELVEKSVGFSGAEIVNVCEEAAMECLRENINSDQIRMQHLQKAVKSVAPQISKEMNEYFENFNKNTIFRKSSM